MLFLKLRNTMTLIYDCWYWFSKIILHYCTSTSSFSQSRFICNSTASFGIVSHVVINYDRSVLNCKKQLLMVLSHVRQPRQQSLLMLSFGLKGWETGISPRVFHLDYRNILFKKRLWLKVEKYLGIIKYAL